MSTQPHVADIIPQLCKGTALEGMYGKPLRVSHAQLQAAKQFPDVGACDNIGRTIDRMVDEEIAAENAARHADVDDIHDLLPEDIQPIEVVVRGNPNGPDCVTEDAPADVIVQAAKDVLRANAMMLEQCIQERYDEWAHDLVEGDL